MQGGALLPDEKTAPIWFVDNVLKSHFTKLSNDKSIDISNFNQAVKKMVTSQLTKDQPPHTCAGCSEPFNGRSSPEHCSHFGLFFHKFKCFPTPRHPCYARKRAVRHSRVHEQRPQNVHICSSLSTTTAPSPAMTASLPVMTASLSAMTAAHPTQQYPQYPTTLVELFPGQTVVLLPKYQLQI